MLLKITLTLRLIYINFINKMKKITKQNFLTNKFSRSNTSKILKILNNFVGSSTTATQLINLLTEQADQFCWYVGHKPAYHIQYQVDSVAILRVNSFIVIVWKPKYIQYPAMIQFPDLKQTKNQKLKLDVDKDLTNLTQGNLSALIEFIQHFFSTYFKKDENFQTNFVTYVKHFISKKTAVSYWHCIYDDDQQTELRNQKDMICIAKIHVSGIKSGYKKCLLLFSCKGERDNILTSISKKWMQLISFIAMVLIFVSVVTCSPSDTQGVCQYRDEAMVGGAGLMMALFGLKIAQRKKNKPNQKLKST